MSEVETTKFGVRSVHKSLGANWMNFQGREIPADYGNSEAEYEAFDQSCAVMDRSNLGRIRISGSTAQDFLHRMTSAPVNNLQVGQGMESIVTTSEGRFVDWVTIYLPSDDHLVMVTGARAAPEVIEFFEGYIFFKEDVEFQDTSEEWTQIQLSGSNALKLAASLGNDLSDADLYEMLSTDFGDSKLWASRVNDITGQDVHLFCLADRSELLWKNLQESDVAWKPVGFSAYNLRRIEAGLPIYPNEINDQYMMLEAHLMRAVDLESGCFNGQEVVARTYNYDKIKQHLCRLEIESAAELSLPLTVYSSDKRIGTLTSLVPKLSGDSAVGLGYIRTKYVKPGTEIRIKTDDKNYNGILLGKTEER